MLKIFANRKKSDLTQKLIEFELTVSRGFERSGLLNELPRCSMLANLGVSMNGKSIGIVSLLLLILTSCSGCTLWRYCSRPELWGLSHQESFEYDKLRESGKSHGEARSFVTTGFEIPDKVDGTKIQSGPTRALHDIVSD